MNPAYQPTGWIDLVPYFLVAAPSILAAVLGFRNTKLNKLHHKENRGRIEELKYEITNDHSTNIRHDIDALAKSVRDGFSETRKDIGGLREELRTERIERIEGDRLRVVYNVGG
ncbi:membrane protein [Mycobacterium phage NothingSpecial]|nr:membrane protein [Mycobacterium phage NothingSpecial]